MEGQSNGYQCFNDKDNNRSEEYLSVIKMQYHS